MLGLRVMDYCLVILSHGNSANDQGGNSAAPSVEAALPQLSTMHEMMGQVFTLELYFFFFAAFTHYGPYNAYICKVTNDFGGADIYD
jgi:hypothetical protein